MIRIKYLLTFLGMTFLLVSFSNCGSSQSSNSISFEANPPFGISEIFSQKWVAGVQEGGSGTNVHIALENLKEDVTINQIYFGEKAISATQMPNDETRYVGYFKNEMNIDVIMDENPIKEAKNTPAETIPFDLKANEAVIAYTVKEKRKYFKVSNIIEKPLIAYPSTNPNGID